MSFAVAETSFVSTYYKILQQCLSWLISFSSRGERKIVDKTRQKRCGCFNEKIIPNNSIYHKSRNLLSLHYGLPGYWCGGGQLSGNNVIVVFSKNKKMIGRNDDVRGMRRGSSSCLFVFLLVQKAAVFFVIFDIYFSIKTPQIG